MVLNNSRCNLIQLYDDTRLAETRTFLTEYLQAFYYYLSVFADMFLLICVLHNVNITSAGVQM